MAGPTLVRDSEEWDACSADLQRLILGRTDRPAGKAGYKLRRSTTGHDKLNRGIQKAALASGVHASWSDAETWAELHGLLTGVPNEVPDVDDRDAVSLFCAKVLMNRTLPPQEDVALPGATDGTTLKDVRARYSDVPSEAAFKDSITVRKAYLTRLLGYETVGSLAYGEPRMREIADAALVALVARVNTEGAKSPATGQESSGADSEAPFTSGAWPAPERQSLLGRAPRWVIAASESLATPAKKTLPDAPGQVGSVEVPIEGKPAPPGRVRRSRPQREGRSESVRLPQSDRKPVARKLPLVLFGGVSIVAIIVAIIVVLAIVAALSGFWGLGRTGARPANDAAAAPKADVATHQVTPASWGPPRDAVSVLSRNSIVTLNSMIDNPVHGDERNFAQVRSSKLGDNTYAKELPIAAGEEYTAIVYFHNDAAPEATASVAENARLRLQVPAVVYGSANVQALLSADNAAPTQIWDGFTLVLPEPSQQAALSFVPDSAVIHNGGNANGQSLKGNALFGSQGVQLGCDALDGKLPSSDKCSGYITFRFVVDQPNFTIDVAARLKGSSQPFANHVNLSPGDVIEVRLAYFNTGTTQQDNVTLRVLGLPKNFRYVAESTKIANSKTKGEYKSTIDGVITTGINLGSYAPSGGNTYVKFDVIVDPASSYAASAQWVEASPFARVTTSGGYKEAGLTFTLFRTTQPSVDKTTATSSSF